MRRTAYKDQKLTFDTPNRRLTSTDVETSVLDAELGGFLSSREPIIEKWGQ